MIQLVNAETKCCILSIQMKHFDSFFLHYTLFTNKQTKGSEMAQRVRILLTRLVNWVWSLAHDEGKNLTPESCPLTSAACVPLLPVININLKPVYYFIYTENV